jgi:hypothetical protein
MHFQNVISPSRNAFEKISGNNQCTWNIISETTPAAPENNCESGTHKIQNFVSTKEHKMVNNRLQAPI